MPYTRPENNDPNENWAGTSGFVIQPTICIVDNLQANYPVQENLHPRVDCREREEALFPRQARTKNNKERKAIKVRKIAARFILQCSRRYFSLVIFSSLLTR